MIRRVDQPSRILGRPSVATAGVRPRSRLYIKLVAACRDALERDATVSGSSG